MNCCEYISDLITAAGTIIATLLAALAAIWFYFRQKEYELVKQRYLDEGLDVVVSSAEEALSVFHHNWARCLELMKSFRDVPGFDVNDLHRGFVEFSERRFSLTANYRVNSIVGSDLVWQAFQLVIAFAQRGCAIAKDEIPDALRVKITTKDIPASRKEIADEALKTLKELDKESHDFYAFISEMHKLTKLLETQKFSTKAIQKLSGNDTVKDVLRALQKRYGERLTVHERAE